MAPAMNMTTVRYGTAIIKIHPEVADEFYILDGDQIGSLDRRTLETLLRYNDAADIAKRAIAKAMRGGR